MPSNNTYLDSGAPPFDNESHDLLRWYPKQRQENDHGIDFEIAIVMAGAVSAGAYTAGVMDFLIEALDEWHKAKNTQHPNCPEHTVKIKIITGASAGGINGAIAASSLPYNFEHIRDDDSAERSGSANPFYSCWVKSVDIKDLLKTDDLEKSADPNQPKIVSLLNCSVLNDVAKKAVSFFNNSLVDAATRSWAKDGLPIVLTTTNLTGVPYRIYFNSPPNNNNYDPNSPGHMMMMHADALHFVAPTEDNCQIDCPPHFLRLSSKYATSQSNLGTDISWNSLAQAALATAAFPFALEAREFDRNPHDYLYKNVAISHLSTTGQPNYITAAPLLNSNETYKFVNIDGGATNNEPFDIAHNWLAGLEGTNPKEAEKACRAILMIDPFCEPEDFNSETQTYTPPFYTKSLIECSLRYLFSAQKNQCRFKMRDLMLAMDENVFSRFLISPKRSNTWLGSRALASGGLSAFLGFFSEKYRHHDYLLGRYNCQQFLRESFSLPKTNPIILVQLNNNIKLQSTSDPMFYPIIPLIGTAAQNCPLPAWPTKQFDYETIKHAIEKRIDKIIFAFSKNANFSNKSDAWYLKVTKSVLISTGIVLAAPVLLYLRYKLKSAVNDVINNAIKSVNERI